MAPSPNEATGATMLQSAAPAAAPVDAMPKMKQLQKQVRLGCTCLLPTLDADYLRLAAHV